LDQLRAELEPGLPSLRWVRSEGIHLTLKFLGDIPVGQLDAVRGALSRCRDEAATEPIRLETAGLGVFPNQRAPRVMWVGFHHLPDPLYHVQRSVEQAMAGLGFPRERRSFRPHLTVGRFRRPLRRGERERLASYLSRNAERTFGGLDVVRLSLFRSTLLPGGARYDEVGGWPLTAEGNREETGSPNKVNEQC
jgi:2'-5' RNA ligase